MKIVSSVPDVGKRSTAAILAEIGDVIWLSNGKQIASWTGLAPSLYQSGVFVFWVRLLSRVINA